MAASGMARGRPGRRLGLCSVIGLCSRLSPSTLMRFWLPAVYTSCSTGEVPHDGRYLRCPQPHPGGLGAICPTPGAGDEHDGPDDTSCASSSGGAGASRPRPPEPPKLLSSVAPPC